MSKEKKTGNELEMREALEMMNTLFEQGAICTSYANSAEEMERIEELYHKAKSAIAKPQRNCDKFRDVDEAYDKFMIYVKRENPTFTKASPLNTAWDALKWVLDGENEEDA